ncbi:hypothetical protein [Streptomyces sp. MJM1172]|nr:hypothetical protein [Streptomyces sp. MJM1172]
MSQNSTELKVIGSTVDRTQGDIRRSQIGNNTPTNCQGSPVIPSGCVN